MHPEHSCLLAIGAHADDIELGVGGMLVKARALGGRVGYVMATNNMSGGHKDLLPDGSLRVRTVGPRESMEVRKRECAAAAARLGTEPIHLDHPQRHYHTGPGTGLVELRYGSALPDGVPADRPTILTAHTDRASIRSLAAVIREHRPDAVFTHGPMQQNIEHVATSMLVTRSYWQAVREGYRGAFYYWLERWAVPGTFGGEHFATWETHVDIGPFLEAKIDLIAEHRSQMPRARDPDFFARRRARAWGHACGCQAAEVFVCVAETRRRTPAGEEGIITELRRNRRKRRLRPPERETLEDIRQDQTWNADNDFPLD